MDSNIFFPYCYFFLINQLIVSVTDGNAFNEKSEFFLNDEWMIGVNFAYEIISDICMVKERNFVELKK